MSSFLWPHGLQPARLLCPWNSPEENTGVGSCSFLQGISPTQEWKPGLLYGRRFLTIWATGEVIKMWWANSGLFYTVLPTAPLQSSGRLLLIAIVTSTLFLSSLISALSLSSQSMTYLLYLERDQKSLAGQFLNFPKLKPECDNISRTVLEQQWSSSYLTLILLAFFFFFLHFLSFKF